MSGRGTRKRTRPEKRVNGLERSTRDRRGYRPDSLAHRRLDPALRDHASPRESGRFASTDGSRERPTATEPTPTTQVSGDGPDGQPLQPL